MRWIYKNEYDNEDNSLTASSEVTLFPIENTRQIHLSQIWKTTGVATESVVIDAGSGNTMTANCVVIGGHNLTNAATIKFQMHTSDSWGTPDLDETLTWREGAIIKYFSSTSKRFARFYFEDAANTDLFISVGRFHISEYLQITPSSLAEFSIANTRTDVVNEGIGNNTYADIGVQYRLFDYSFPPSNFTMVESLRTFYETVGKYKPFWLMNYDSTYDTIEPAYARLTNDFIEEWSSKNRIAYKVTLKEVT